MFLTLNPWPPNLCQPLIGPTQGGQPFSWSHSMQTHSLTDGRMDDSLSKADAVRYSLLLWLGSICGRRSHRTDREQLHELYDYSYKCWWSKLALRTGNSITFNDRMQLSNIVLLGNGRHLDFLAWPALIFQKSGQNEN